MRDKQSKDDGLTGSGGDPAEKSRETVERELRKQAQKKPGHRDKTSRDDDTASPGTSSDTGA